MNKKKALELFRENLEKYLNEGFIFHPLFVEELGKLINGAQGKNFNIRLLMTFDLKENPVFLVAFYERSGKRKSSYSEYKDVMRSRFEELGD